MSTAFPGTIHLLMRDGPRAGQRIACAGNQIRFGRAADNDAILGLDTVSRHHGCLEYADGNWTLRIEGKHAVRVNGRGLGRRPRALQNRDVISVGGSPLFEVLIEAVAAADNGTSPTEVTPAQGRPRFSRRAALWMGIVVYLLFMTGLVIFFTTLRSDPAEGTPALTQLTPANIADIVRRPLPPEQPYAAHVDAALARARPLAERLDARPDKLYEAYNAYRQAMAWSPGHRLTEGRDILAYHDVRQQLTDAITTLYVDGYQHFMSHQYDAAEEAFVELLTLYPEANSPAYRNVEAFLSKTRSRRSASRKNRRRGLF